MNEILERPSPTSREAFLQMAEDIGFTPSEIRAQSEDSGNLIPFPSGEGNGVRVGNSHIEGQGLFATVYFDTGDDLCPAAIAEMRTPAGRYINHSDEPNAYFRCEPTGRVIVVAKKAIRSGEEITVNYRQSKQAALLAHQILKGVH